jgi:transposase
MMGRLDGGAEKLFYAFSLEEAVPTDHLLRKIARFPDFDGLRTHLRPYYSDIGRPSVDPELMVRMLLVGYCFGIRSERRLCEEVHLNLAYRRFCRLGLEDRVPDHSTFSKARHGRHAPFAHLPKTASGRHPRPYPSLGGDRRRGSA